MFASELPVKLTYCNQGEYVQSFMNYNNFLFFKQILKFLEKEIFLQRLFPFHNNNFLSFTKVIIYIYIYINQLTMSI